MKPIIEVFDIEENKWKEIEVTHKVSFWGIRCFYDDTTGALVGVNNIFNKLIDVAIWFHNTMSDITCFFFPDWEPKGFPLKTLEEYEDDI